MTNEHLVPQLIRDLVLNKNKPWKSLNQRHIDYARLTAIRDFITAALEAAPGPEYIEKAKTVANYEYGQQIGYELSNK